MKNRSFRLTAMSAMALTAVLLGSCSADDTQEVTNPSQQAVVSQNALTFTFSLPEGAPVTYALHDAPEWNVRQITLLEFDATSKVLESMQTLTVAPVSDPTNGDVHRVGNALYSYTKDLGNSSTTDKKVFAFVANVDMTQLETQLSVNTSTLADYMNLEFKDLTTSSNFTSKTLLWTAGGENDLMPMSGFADAGSGSFAVQKSAANVNVKLKRAVARVDVKSNHNTLKVLSVSVLKSNKTAKVAEAVGGAYIPNPTQALANTDAPVFAGFATSTDAVNGDAQLKKAAYLYEDGGTIASGEEVIIQVKAKLNGNEVLYNIPFKNGADVVQVKRNFLYTIELGEAGTPPPTSGKIKFTIKVRDWEDGGTASGNFTGLKIAMGTGAGTYSEVYDLATDTTKRTLTVDNTQQDNTLTLTSGWQSATFSVTVDNAYSTWLSATVESTNNLKITTQANGTGAVREGFVKVKSENDGQAVERLVYVKQNS